jgi:hypothetical protein
MTKQSSWKIRDQIASNELRKALSVPDPKRTSGKSILVYDDVFTDGHTLDEVAHCLRLQGEASEVCGVTLTRQPWGKALAFLCCVSARALQYGLLRLGVEIPLHFISKYEHNVNEPPLMVLLAYSRVSSIPLDNIIDDDLDLPMKFP